MSATPEQKQTFLDELTATGSFTKAQKKSGVRNQTLYALRVSDPEFDQAWETALIKYFKNPDPANKTKRPARKGGRQSGYDPLSHPESARKLKARGFSDEDVALAFGIANSTFASWKDKYSEFGEAVKAGRDDLANKTAIRSLYALMNGYEHPEEKIFYNAVLDKVVRVETTRHLAPNVTAIIFWLCNKCKAEFQSISNQRVELNTDGLKALADVLKAGPVPRAKGGTE